MTRTPILPGLMKLRRGGFSLLELLIALAIVAVLIACSMPVFNSMRDTQNVTQATSQLRKMMTTWQLYASEHNQELMPSFSGWWEDGIDGGNLPGSTWWVAWMQHYHPGEVDPSLGNYGFLMSPARGPIEQSRPNSGTWLALNWYVGTRYAAKYSQPQRLTMMDLKHPHRTVVFADALYEQYMILDPNFTFRYKNNTSSLFALADGHIELTRTRREDSPPVASSAFAPPQYIYNPLAPDAQD